MKVERQEIDQLNSTITILLEPGDYEPNFLDELKKYKSKVQMKGFRKGKTPMGVIKKMYGQSVLAEIVMDQINKGLTDFISEEKIDILGQPLPKEDQQQYDFDPNNLSDMEFRFDVGMAPEFDIQGVEDEFRLYDVSADDKTIEEELNVARRRFGKQEEVEDNIEEKDMLTISAWELEDGEKKEKGWETGFTVLVEMVGDEKVKKIILAGKAGLEFDFDIYNIEKDRDEAHVKKYFLNMDEEEEQEVGKLFRGKIDKVARIAPAELNGEFFTNYFGNEEVTTEEEAKNKIKEEIEKYYEHQSKLVMNREVMEHLMDKNNLSTPDTFLKKWLTSTNENTSAEEIEKDYESFQKNLQWTLIKNKFSDKYDVVVSPEHIRNNMRQKISSYMQGYPMDDNQMNEMIDRLLKDKEQVNKTYEEIQAMMIFDALEKDLNLKKEPIGIEEFKEVVKSLNETASN